MAFLCPQLFDSSPSLSAGEALVVLGWILTVHYGACRGILAHPDFSPLHPRAAGQQHEAVPPSGKSSVAQNSVPEYLPPSVCRAQRRMNRFGCREAVVPFLTKIPALWKWEGPSSAGVGVRGGEDPLSPLHGTRSPLDLPRSQQEGAFSLLACVPADFPFASSNLALVPRA